MPNDLERAARSMAEAVAKDSGRSFDSLWGSARFRGQMFLSARAVIASLMEPSEEMLIAGVIANQDRMVGDVWKAMLSTILNEQTKD